jgi:hypothetical protein
MVLPTRIAPRSGREDGEPMDEDEDEEEEDEEEEEEEEEEDDDDDDEDDDNEEDGTLESCKTPLIPKLHC